MGSEPNQQKIMFSICWNKKMFLAQKPISLIQPISLQLSHDKNGITDSFSTADCCQLLTICPRCCLRHAPDADIKSLSGWLDGWLNGSLTAFILRAPVVLISTFEIFSYKSIFICNLDLSFNFKQNGFALSLICFGQQRSAWKFSIRHLHLRSNNEFWHSTSNILFLSCISEYVPKRLLEMCCVDENFL